MDKEISLNRKIIRLAVPTMLASAFQAFYDIVDMFWIGWISQNAVAAITVFTTYFWIIELFNEVVGSSSVAMISQYHGEGNMEKERLAAEQTLTFKFLLALIGATVMIATIKPVLGFLSGGDTEIVSLGVEYGMIRAFFLPVFFSSYSVNTIFRCGGDAKTPMWLLSIAAVMNMVLDPLLMFDRIPVFGTRGLGLGMRGAAWATVISITFSFATGMALLLAGKGPVKPRWRKLFRLDPATDRKLFTIGLPNGLTLALSNLVSVYLLRLISSYPNAIAYVGIAGRLLNFAIMPSSGVAVAGGVVVGNNLGRNDEKSALEASKKSRNICLAMVSALAFFMIVFPKALLSAFLGGQDAPREGWSLVAIAGVSAVVVSLGAGYNAAFQGGGYMRPLLWSSVVSYLGVMVPLTLAAKLLGAGVIMIWAAYLTAVASDVLVKYLFWRRMRWLKHRV